MKICLLIILFFIAEQATHSQNSGIKCNITYIANEGFLVETANHKILVDALFGGIKGNWCDQPNDSVARLMVHGMPPFDRVDIILVTHFHSDHFNADMMMEFLLNNSKCKLVCPIQVVEKLRDNQKFDDVANNIISPSGSIPFDSTILLKDMAIRVLGLSHGSYFENDSAGNPVDLHKGVKNFGYLLDVDSCKILHTGDGSPSTNKKLYAKYCLGDIKLDIAFLDRVFLSKDGQELLNQIIHSKKIILMHIEPSKKDFFNSYAASIPFMVVFSKSLESKDFY